MQFFTLVVLHAAKLTEPPVIPGVLDMADFGPRTRQIRVESIQPSGLQTIEGVLPWGQIDPNDAWALAEAAAGSGTPRPALHLPNRSWVGQTAGKTPSKLLIEPFGWPPFAIPVCEPA